MCLYFGFTCPAFKANGPYYIFIYSLSGSLYHILQHYLLNGAIFGKSCLNIKCVCWFSLQLLPETCHSKNNSARYDIWQYVFMYSTLYIYQVLIEIECSRQILKISSNTKLRENPSSGSRNVSWWQTDWQADMMKLTVAFHDLLNAPQMTIWEILWQCGWRGSG